MGPYDSRTYIGKEDGSRAPTLTCMPHTLTPRVRLVVLSHFFRWLFFFRGVASMPYCLVPIFKSSTQECFKLPVKSSIKMKWFCLVTEPSVSR